MMKIALMWLSLAVVTLGVLLALQVSKITALQDEVGKIDRRMDKVVWVADGAVDTAYFTREEMKKLLTNIDLELIFIKGKLHEFQYGGDYSPPTQ